MSEKIKICIADDNIDSAKSIAKYLSQNEKIYVTAICKDGQEAVDSIMNENVDFLLIDVIMPKLDGVGVIEKINEEYEKGKLKTKPNIIIVSAILHDYFKFDIFNKGVNYYMTKPIDVDMLEQRILEIYNYDQNNEYKEKAIDENITKILYQIGIFPNLTGYRYTKKAIELLVYNPLIRKDFRKQVYKVIAEKDEIEVATVERAIINAVSTSWRKEKENVSELLKNTRYIGRKPSTTILLATIAEKIRNLI